ncbi:NSS family neurotransmitter:Na+ symporter [Streptomonospora nanhaiensis]|uniref:Transporter n=1 Tax=Streptomonospora nanhaiensis TaxID=1323731 RepID=A0A853BKZ4_9ACTN|nr:sodium-dependent transporter [Streptomonospora nanhaiensis]NYI95327.1 NSS family neurotransmitter:Na+ symporter [Streptomonospora nanhaiensis]
MAQEHREQWGSRTGFLLAAIGSAVGLGNIWRFPYIAYENGGGAFLVPYLVALLTAGIPLLIMEYAIGHRFRGSAPASFRRMSRPTEALGWWQVAISFVIAVYYAVIVAWGACYAWFSLTQAWGEDPDAFLFQDFLQVSEAPGAITGYVPGVLWPLVGVWIVVLVILVLGVRRGIEWANRIFIPLLGVLFAILVVQALFLDGAEVGLDALFAPDWSAITDGSVWVAAYGQIFFSLSVGFGIMITYSSYLRRRSDLTGSAMVAGFANSSFEILAGIGVFATLGFMAVASGVPVDEVATSGIGLAFVAFPQIISNLPFGAALFGVLFFVSLVIAGLTSLISIVQVVVSAVQDRLGMRRVPAALLVGGVTAAVSILLFPTNQGLYILDAADHFINQYGIVLAGLVSVVVVAWIVRRLPMLEAHAAKTSVVALTWWWRITLSVVTPIVLGFMMYDSLRAELASNYEDYPTWFLLTAGWGVAGAALVLGILISLLPWKNLPSATADPDDPEPGTAAAADDAERGR